MRILVWDILQWRGAGVSEDEILADYPELEKAPHCSSGSLTLAQKKNFNANWICRAGKVLRIVPKAALFLSELAARKFV
jgi:uncharacterized protein DUF433